MPPVLLLALAPSPAESEPIADLSKPFLFTYGAWDGRARVEGERPCCRRRA